MRLLALAGDIGALHAGIRLVTPLAALARQTGWTLALRSFHEVTLRDLRRADVLVVQRGASARVWRLERAMRAAGAAVVYEIDDLLTEVAPHISQHALMRERGHWVRRCLAEAELVAASTAPLAEALRPLTREVAVVPNFAFDSGPAEPPEPQPGAPVHLLFASSDRFEAQALQPVLQALLTLPPERVRVVVVGPPAQDFAAAGVVVDARPLLPRAEFVALARALPNPLAVIPLEDSHFAACKSAVKWFDYAAAGVPALASDVVPYRGVVRDGVTGALVAADAVAWSAALGRAVADAAWRGRVAQAARAEVLERYTLRHTVQAWHRVLERAWALRGAAKAPWGRRALTTLVAPALDLAEAAGVAMRRLNRERLSRRRRS